MKKITQAVPDAMTAAPYLAEFVGDIPRARLDICGPMKVDADVSWRSKGATGVGARMLAELATNFKPPRA